MLSSPALPLEFRWNSARMPLKEVTAPVDALPAVGQAPGYWISGPAELPFDFSFHIRRICADIASRCDDFHHIKTEKLLFGFTVARKASSWGLQARVTPLRFPGGRLTQRQNGAVYRVQRHFVDSREMLYLVTFCLPRFFNRAFHDKLVTIFHELYHIGPAFDGDLRRHPGRCQLHTQSQKQYDAGMAEMVKEYLRSGPDPAIVDFLRMNHAQLMARHKCVVANAFPRPMIVPV